MGITKSDQFRADQNQLAALFKALGHPARIAILQHIIKTQSCICNDLVDEIGLAQATISQHLKQLKNTGLIKGSIEGASVCYCIDEEIWEQSKSLLNLFFVEVVNKDCC